MNNIYKNIKVTFQYKILVVQFLIVYPIQLFSQVSITDITSSNLIGDALNDGNYGGHGLMFADVDADGDPDLYITMNNNYPMPDLYFVNNGSGVFTESGVIHGIDDADDGSHGWIWADLDNDGDYDGWNGSYTENIPYRNKNNQLGYFDDMFLTSGIENINNKTRGVTTLDFDNDGDLDLFANNWYARNDKEDNEFYRNNGDFTFTRIDNGLSGAKGDQGVCDGDFDNDGDMDLLLSVFEGGEDSRCVEIWENVNGQFVRLTNSGINLCNASYDGNTFWDMDNDGWLDVVSREKIYRNNGNKTFTEVSDIPMAIYTYMRGIADLNNDGFWDLVVPGVDTVYLGNGDFTFTNLNYNVGTINDPRCVSFADIDDDGDVDFALAQKRIYNRLYRNDYNGSNKYLKIGLTTSNNQIGAFGAKVYLYSIIGDTLLSYRQAHANQGYLSQDDPVLHFGCGQRDSVKVKIKYLSGEEYEFISATNKTIKNPSNVIVKIFLSGPYTNGQMTSVIEPYLPIVQPFNTFPWNYSENQSINSSLLLNNEIVDWLLLELRNPDTNGNGIVVSRTTALLKSDGTVIDLDGSDNVKFWNVASGNYYLIVHHRNHLSVQSSIPVLLN